MRVKKKTIFQLYSNGIIEFLILHGALFMWMIKIELAYLGKEWKLN